MLETYELWFETDGAPQFEALTCHADHLMPTVRQRLAEVGASRVEVRQFGEALFTLAR